MKKTVSACLAVLAAAAVCASPSRTPLEWARLVADNVVDRVTPGFEYVMQAPYPDVEFIDFGISCAPVKGVAYGLTTMHSQADQEHTFAVGRTAGLKIWIDDELVFEGRGARELPIVFDERTYELPESFTVRLAAGDHRVLVKSEYTGDGKWLFLLQGPNMSRYAEKGQKISCSLKNYAPKVTHANWLVLGTFEGDVDTPCPPEREDGFYRVYRSGGRQFGWNIPRINLLIDNRDGGKFFSWSYHVGGFVWALQRLGAATGDPKYGDYAARWCDYALETVPLAEYQTRELHAVRSMNFGQADRPMLDYYSAPAMPYVTRLTADPDFAEKEVYEARARKVVEYLKHRQFRIDGIFARTYTRIPSIWVDDMFMGLPYLVYWAKYTDDPAEREALLDDASTQVLTFNRYLFEPSAGLYRQACYPSRPEDKVPFWSRGNGWAFWATSEVLEALPRNHKNYKAILSIYRKHAQGLVRCQDGDGFWRNVLDMEGSVRESSGAAIFTMNLARGINNGWLSRKEYGPAVEKAWAALTTFVDENGDFNGVKAGTNFSTDPMDYERVKFVKSDTHGLLPFVFACLQMDRFCRERR